MRIAFASCMCSQVFKDQPVWDQIAEQQPDYLVMLGDSIYLDINVPSYPDNPGMPIGPQNMNDETFMRHLFERYTAQLNQPQFAKLVKQMPNNRVFSIWDDHDFLWNDACGAEFTKGMAQQSKIVISTSFQEAFRRALAQSLAQGSFPNSYTDSAFMCSNQPPMSAPSINLNNQAWLHLSDGRTYRTRTWLISDKNCTLLGSEQRGKFGEAIRADLNAIHLFASGSTISGWKHYPNDLNWIKKLAAKSRTLVLSGDIHRNEVDIFPDTGGFPLHEATSSGAAVRTGVVVGGKQENFGLLDIGEKIASVRLFHRGSEQNKLARSYDIQTWQDTSS